MEENTLDLLGLQLVDYFISFQSYQPFNIPEKHKEHAKGKVYLVNKDTNKYQVIKIVKQNVINLSDIKTSHDNVIEHIKDELKNPTNFKVLIIVLNTDGKNETQQSPTLDTIIATPPKAVRELSKFFPTITNVIKSDFSEGDEINVSDDDDDEQQDDVSPREQKWKKINFQNRRFLKDALAKSTNSHLTITWLFFALPIITYFVYSIIANSYQGLDNNLNIQTLFFGGAYNNLIIGANQYWRWLTYPFIDFKLSGISLIFSLWMFLRIGRFIEGFYGPWKAAIIWVGSIILVGVVQTTVDNYNILSGFWVVALISVGAMIPIVYNYKLFKSNLMMKLVTTFIWFFLFWVLFDEQLVTLLYWMIALAVGWTMGALVSYHNRKLTLFYAFSPISVGLLLLFFVLVYFLNPYYHYDDQGYTIRVLELYKNVNLVSQDFINWVLTSYFHIPFNK